MSDTCAFIESVGRPEGFILLNWQIPTLERQIEYGAQLGEVDLNIAKQELEIFRKQGIPVAEFFNSKQMLSLVAGDRKPDIVFSEFSEKFESIVKSHQSV